MKIPAFLVALALGFALTACGGGKEAPKPVAGLSGAQSIAQEATQPASVEEVLKGIYSRLGLQDVTVGYGDGTARVAFEQPDLPVGAVQALYLQVLDLAALNAPFSQQVVMVAKVGGRPLVGIAGRTEDIRAFRQEQLKIEDYVKRLTYSIAPK